MDSPAPISAPPLPLNQTVTTWPATSVVISNMIGTGVFTSLGWQILSFHQEFGGHSLDHGLFTIVALWMVGGIVALCGALCYAELAAALPHSGGEYFFLSRIYHPLVGFCTGMTSATVGFAAPIAISALFFGRYLMRAFPDIQKLAQLWPAKLEHNLEHLLAVILVIVITLAHLRSLRFSGRFQGFTTLTTMALIIGFIFMGFFFTPAQPITFLPRQEDIHLIFSQAFATCLLYVMYSYAGWNAAAYIGGEIRDPGRTLPRALSFGTIGVTILYVLVNAAFLFTTPVSVLSGQPEVADFAGREIFGERGARLISLLICVGLVANVSSMVWIGSRISQALGEDYRALSFWGKTSPQGIPFVALWVQLIFAVALSLMNISDLVIYLEWVLSFWCFLTVMGTIVLRIREPDLPRPYRVLGFPLTPLIFSAMALYASLYTSWNNPWLWQAGASTILLGVPIYFAARFFSASRP